MPALKCAVHKDVSIFLNETRKEVCRDLPIIHQWEGETYCVLHFPDENKSENTDFESVLEKRINNEQNNYSFVFMPVNHSFKGKTLSGFVKFYRTTFTDEAQFGETIFADEARFIHTKFEQGADFDKAVFKSEVAFNLADFKGGGFFRETKFNGKSTFWNTDLSTVGLFNNAVFFQKANFTEAKFGGDAHFDNVTFQKDINFNLCKFARYAYFSGANFIEGGDFTDATFNDKTFFSRTLFSKSVDFSKVKFAENSQVDFHNTIFKDEVYFYKSIIEGYVDFLGTKHQTVFYWENAWLNFRQTRIEKAKRISFGSVRLRPSWFVDVDSRSFVFHDVDWENADGTRKKTDLELKALQNRKITGRPHRLLTIACRQLAVNAEENNHYEQASGFRRMAMELSFWEKRLELKKWIVYPFKSFNTWGETRKRYKRHWKKVYERWKKRNKPTLTFLQAFDLPHLIYRWLSYYGESWARAFLWLIGIIIISAVLFTSSLSKFENRDNGLNKYEALFYSLRVMILQRPEPFPENSFAKGVLALESVFAPLQAALLALAIRRKFMR